MGKKKNKKKKAPAHVELNNVQLNAVHFDGEAIEAIQTIAFGLAENAKALGELANVFKNSNVNVDHMIKVVGYGNENKS